MVAPWAQKNAAMPSETPHSDTYSHPSWAGVSEQ